MPYAASGGSTSGWTAWVVVSSDQIRPSAPVSSADRPSRSTTASSNPASADEKCSRFAAKSADRSTARMARSVDRSNRTDPATWISGRGPDAADEPQDTGVDRGRLPAQPGEPAGHHRGDLQQRPRRPEPGHRHAGGVRGLPQELVGGGVVRAEQVAPSGTSLLGGGQHAGREVAHVHAAESDPGGEASLP